MITNLVEASSTTHSSFHVVPFQVPSRRLGLGLLYSGPMITILSSIGIHVPAFVNSAFASSEGASLRWNLFGTLLERSGILSFSF